MSKEILLDVKNLKTQFKTKAGPLLAVNNVSFQLGSGEILGLVGESGSGKSVTGFSLMRLIDKPGEIIAGEIKYNNQDLRKLTEKKMRHLRGNRIAMIFQDPMMTLNPVLRIDTQMIETLQAHKKISHQQAKIKALETLKLMGIPSPEERLRAYPHQLSGGMRQRVAIAIALLLKPDIIIADEPTTALDVTIQSQILSEIQNLTKKYGTALIWITHDLSVVAGLADKLAVMYAGEIVESGTINQVLTNPQHPYTQGLISSLPSQNTPGNRLQQIEGITPNLLNLPKGCPFLTRCHRAQDICKQEPTLKQIPNNHTAKCFFPTSDLNNQQEQLS